MLRNYFLTALRNIWRHKSQAAIAVFGLAVGFTSFLVIGMYVLFEHSYDAFHPYADRIYAVGEHAQQEDGTINSVLSAGYGVGITAQEDLQEVDLVAQMAMFGSAGYRTAQNEDLIEVLDVFIASKEFFQIFGFELLSGSLNDFGDEPNVIMLSESRARFYYGDENPVGGTMYYHRSEEPFKVVGVFQDPSENSQFHGMEVVHSNGFLQQVEPDFWENRAEDFGSAFFYTFIRLKDGSDVEVVTSSLNERIDARLPEDNEVQRAYTLEPITETHLTAIEQYNRYPDPKPNRADYLYGLGVLAAFLLLIGCINYLNLSSAWSSLRMREVGIRKVFGARRQQLIGQFTGEAFIIVLFGLLVALGAASLLLPGFNQLAARSLTFGSLGFSNWLLLIGGVVALALLAGGFQSFVMSRVGTTTALKGDKLPAGLGPMLRKGLIVVQFWVCLVFLTGTLLINRQMDFVKNKDLGFSTDNVISVEINGNHVRNKWQEMRYRFEQVPGVRGVSIVSRVPNDWKGLNEAKLSNPQTEQVSFVNYASVDSNFYAVMDIPIVSGRKVSEAANDTFSLVLTQQAAKDLGIAEANEQVIRLEGFRRDGRESPLNNPIDFRVVGIANDLQFLSLKQAQTGVVFGHVWSPLSVMDNYIVKLDPARTAEALEQLAAVYVDIDPDNPFDYSFLDERYADNYAAEALQGQLLFIASILVLVLSLFGLFALASFAAKRRLKEISIRKVLGASVGQIVLLLNKQFLWLILIASVLAIPLAYLGISQWLQGFAYRVNINVFYLLLPVVVVLVIALLTVSGLTMRAARTNPADNFREE